MGKVQLFVSKLNEDLDKYDFLFDLVSEERREKALRYKIKKDQIRSLIAGYLMEKTLKTKEFLINENGKPYVKDSIYFNVSHSGNYVCLALSSFEVGIDIEEILNKDYSFIEKFFKVNNLSKNKAYSLWTNSESFVKCLGTGIKDIKNIPLLTKEGEHVYKNKRYFTKNFIIDNHSFSITIEDNHDFEIEQIEIDIKKPN